MFPQWNQTFQTMDPSQQLYWQQYYGYQTPAVSSAMWGNAVAAASSGTVAQPTQTNQVISASVAVSPPEPPKEEAPPPPLPSDPPPPVPEDPQPPADSHELQKLTALQQQAAQWQQQKQWQEYQQSLLQYQQQLQQWNAQQASILEQIKQEENEFEMQYSDWMKQYNEWKEQNRHHPNHAQYLQYEQQWKQYEEQMAQKREYIKQRKAQALMNQQMAQTPDSHSFATTNPSMSSVAAHTSETKTDVAVASAVSCFASPSYGSGMIYTSSSGQPAVACPPVSVHMYAGYGYSAGNVGAGPNAQNQRFMPPALGQGASAWHQQPVKPDSLVRPPGPTSTFDPGLKQIVSSSDYENKPPVPNDFVMHNSSQYGAQRQPTPSDFGIGKPAGFGMLPQDVSAQVRFPLLHGTGDQAAGTSKLGTFGLKEAPNFSKTVEMPPASTNTYYHGQYTGMQSSRFPSSDMNVRFSGPPGSGAQTGMYDSGCRPPGLPGPGGVRMQQDTSVTSMHGLTSTAGRDSNFSTCDQRTDLVRKDPEASTPFSGAWGVTNTMPPFDSVASNVTGPSPRFPGHITGQASSEFSSRGTGVQNQRMPAVSQQSGQFSGTSSSDRSESMDSGPGYPGMTGSRWPHRPDSSDAGPDVSRFPGHFNSRSSSTKPPDSRLSGPQMPNLFSACEPPGSNLERRSGPSDETQGSFKQQSSVGPRFTGPDIHQETNSGQPRFPGTLGSGIRPSHDSVSNSANTRHQGPRGPGFSSDLQQEHSFGDARFPGPRGPNPRPDFQQDFGFGGPRFPGPRSYGPWLDKHQRPPVPGGARFMGPPGPRAAHDPGLGEARYPGPRGPNAGPELGSAESFPRPRGPDFQQEFRLGGPRMSGTFGSGTGLDNQQARMKFDARLPSGMEAGTRFCLQGQRPPSDLPTSLKGQQGSAEAEVKFSGAGPPASGQRPPFFTSGAPTSGQRLPFSSSSTMPNSAEVKTSVFDAVGRSLTSQSGPLVSSLQSPGINSESGKRPDTKSDSAADANQSKSLEPPSKPEIGLKSLQSSAESGTVSSSAPATSASFEPKNFDSARHGIRPAGANEGVPSWMSQKHDSFGQNLRPSGPTSVSGLPLSAPQVGESSFGRGVRPTGPGALPRFPGAGPPGSFGPGPGSLPRFQCGPDSRLKFLGPRGQMPETQEMTFTKWQAPTGLELEEESVETEHASVEATSFGSEPHGRLSMSSGPRFPGPGSMPGIPRGMRPPFLKGAGPRFRPRFGGDFAARMKYGFPGPGSYPLPGEELSTEVTDEYIPEEQEDFAKDYGEEGFFGKRKVQDFVSEDVCEEELSPAVKFGRMESGVREPLPRMPSGRGFGPRGPQGDVNLSRFGGPMFMRPRLDPGSFPGRMVRPSRGPVPLMQLNVRPAAAVNLEGQLDPESYQEAEFPEEVDAEGQQGEPPGAELGRFPHFGLRGPAGMRGGLPGPPRMAFGPRGTVMRWPRPPMDELHSGIGRGGLGNARVPFNAPRGRGPLYRPGFGQSHVGFQNDSQNEEFVEESYIGLQPLDAEYDEECNPVDSDQNWDSHDYEEPKDPEEPYATDDPACQVDSEGLPIQFSERQHELIKKAAEELKLLRQKQDQIEVLESIAPVLEKPKPPVSNLVPYPNDDVEEESEEVRSFKDERAYLDRDDRFLANEGPPLKERPGGFTDERRGHPDEEYGAEEFRADPYRRPWHEDHPRRPLPLDFDFRGPPRGFEPGHREPPWREDPDFREGRFPRLNMDDYGDRRHFDGRSGPPPDWDRRTPPFSHERGPHGMPLPPLPNPREFLDNLEGHSRGPPFGHGPPPFESYPQSGTSAVFEYGHGDSATEEHERRRPSVEPVEEYWQERDEDTRFRRWERDRDFRHVREQIPGDYDRDRRAFLDVHERPGWQEHRDHDFPGSIERERSRGRDHDSRGSSDQGSREPQHWVRGREFPDRERDRDFREHDRRGHDRDDYRERGGRHAGSEDPFPRHHVHGHKGPLGPGFVEEPKIEVTAVDDLLALPGRRSRPDHIVVIIRGPPGAGKTFVSKLLKDKEVANGGTAPRMLCLDDYFMVETEKMVEDAETGKKTKKTVMEYEYDPGLEPSYKVSFLKSFKRQIDDCYFNFIVVDAVFDKVEYMDEFWSYAKSKGFQVYVVETQAEVSICVKRNTHQRKQADIQKIIDGWDETPRHYIRLDVRSLLQDAAIEDVEMEDTANDVVVVKSDEDKAEEETEEEAGLGLKKSKWEMDTSEQHLDKLDGIRAGMKKHEVVPQRLEDYLQLPDDYDSRKSEPGKKRVRWADIEERKDQLRRRELGFVIGQTDWAKMTDDSYADRALNRTKYF